MAEGVALDARGRIGDQDLPGDALPEGLVQRRVIERGSLGHEVGVDPLACRRRDPQELLGRLAELGNPREEDVPERGGQVAAVAGPARAMRGALADGWSHPILERFDAVLAELVRRASNSAATI